VKVDAFDWDFATRKEILQRVTLWLIGRWITDQPQALDNSKVQKSKCKLHK
jgi:hypothetical protein